MQRKNCIKILAEYKYESGWLLLLSVCRKTNDLSMVDKMYKYIADIFAKEARTMGAASNLMSHLYAHNYNLINRVRSESG